MNYTVVIRFVYPDGAWVYRVKLLPIIRSDWWGFVLPAHSSPLISRFRHWGFDVAGIR